MAVDQTSFNSTPRYDPDFHLDFDWQMDSVEQFPPEQNQILVVGLQIGRF